MRKYIKYILILIVLAGLFSPMVKMDAQYYNPQQIRTGANPVTGQPKPSATTGYKLLAPLPCESGPGCDPTTKTLETFDPSTGLGSYLNLMIKIFIGICAVLSVVMIIVGGMEYMTSELAHTKEAGKERITHALLGLVIALGAYALLNTINPDLLKSDIKPDNVTVTPPAVSSGVDGNVTIDLQTGRSIYVIHTPNTAVNSCSVPPEGYRPATIIGGPGQLCGTERLPTIQATTGFYPFCCKYDRSTN